MENILCLLKGLLSPHKFILEMHQYNPEIFGNYEVVFSRDNLRIRFIKDRSQVFMDVSQVAFGDDWTPVEAVLQKKKINVPDFPSDEESKIRQYVSILLHNVDSIADVHE